MAVSAATRTPTTRFDIGSDEIAADPWPGLRELSGLGPVVWHETLGRWLVTADQETRDILARFERFSVEGTSMQDLFGAEAFISMDDRRRHDRLRQVWAAAFRQQGLEALRPVVQATVDRLLAPVVERLRSGEAVDLSDAICRPLPTMVIALMMGVPDEAIPDVVRWSDAMASGSASYLPEAQAKRARAARDDGKTQLAAYLGRLIAERRATPGADLISTLVQSEPGRELPDEHLVQNVRQLLFAGNETTAKWLAHIFVTYGERPGVRRELAADRTLVVAANEEVMRWQTVVGTTVRRVRGGPTVVAGIAMAEGDEVTCLLAAANRDPARYRDPDTFDLHRPRQPNLGFGAGLHNCLGAMLARMEAERAVNGLLDAAPDFAVAAPYRYSSVPLRGPLPVIAALDRS